MLLDYGIHVDDVKLEIHAVLGIKIVVGIYFYIDCSKIGFTLLYIRSIQHFLKRFSGNKMVLVGVIRFNKKL